MRDTSLSRDNLLSPTKGKGPFSATLSPTIILERGIVWEAGFPRCWIMNGWCCLASDTAWVDERIVRSGLLCVCVLHAWPWTFESIFRLVNVIFVRGEQWMVGIQCGCGLSQLSMSRCCRRRHALHSLHLILKKFHHKSSLQSSTSSHLPPNFRYFLLAPL